MLFRSGYQPMGGSTLRISTVETARRANLSESFFIRHTSASSTGGLCAIDGPNQWPNRPEGFRAALEQYDAALRDLGLRLARVMALALEQEPEAFLAHYFQRPATALRLLHYPPARRSSDGAYGIAPHTDYGFVTLLAQDNQGGLEIRRADGTWQPVPPQDETFVVNIGNALSLMKIGRAHV